MHYVPITHCCVCTCVHIQNRSTLHSHTPHCILSFQFYVIMYILYNGMHCVENTSGIRRNIGTGMRIYSMKYGNANIDNTTNNEKQFMVYIHQMVLGCKAHFKANFSTLFNDCVQQIVGTIVATSNKFISHSIIDVQQIMGILSSIFYHLVQQWPT